MSNTEIPILRLFSLFGISMVFFDIQYAPKKIEYKILTKLDDKVIPTPFEKFLNLYS